jgi:hypothetical protein
MLTLLTLYFFCIRWRNVSYARLPGPISWYTYQGTGVATASVYFQFLLERR